MKNFCDTNKLACSFNYVNDATKANQIKVTKPDGLEVVPNDKFKAGDALNIEVYYDESKLNAPETPTSDTEGTGN